MEHHVLVLNDSNESSLCRGFVKVWASSAPVVYLFASKTSEDLSNLQVESEESEAFRDSTPELNSFKHLQLYKQLNKVGPLSQQDFTTLHTNLSKALKTNLFRPLLLLFKKENGFQPNVVFNLKSILLYYYPHLNKEVHSSSKRADKELLYWLLEFDYSYSYVGTANRLADLLEQLEASLDEYNLESQFVQLQFAMLKPYLDALLFRRVSLNKCPRVLKHAKQCHAHVGASFVNTFATATAAHAAGVAAARHHKGESDHDAQGSESDENHDHKPQEGSKRAEMLDLSEYRKLFLDNKKPYHLASAIAYTNGYPHVGHAYEAVVCDVISRYYRVFGRPVIFSTGTDEHGIKVMTTAKQQNKAPIEICDYYSHQFKLLYKRLLVDYDRFIRTTSETHIKAAKSIWRRVHSRGDIYLGKYNGYYSVREERFIPNTEAKLTDFKDPVSGKPYDLMSESSYFFTMDKYRNKLVKYITDNEDFIYPVKCRNEILARLKEPLEDLSISRTSFDWGIHVPRVTDSPEERHGDYYNGDVNVGYNEDNKLFNESKFHALHNRDQVAKKAAPDPSTADLKAGASGSSEVLDAAGEKHVMYVWFDALSFYMTAAGLDLQVIGKDICWFQSVILATMCFSMELPLTRRILAHGFIQGPDGRKMSKSLGNVLNLDELLADVGPEPFRYYLMKSTILGQDVNFDVVQLKEMYNSDLADNVGNLVHRITNLTHKYSAGGEVPEYKVKLKYPFDFAEFLKEASSLVLRLDLYSLLGQVNAKFKELNNYLTVKSPWAEPDADKRDSTLRLLLESVYFLTHFLFPVLPESSAELFKKLGTPKKDHVWELSLNLDNLDKGSKVSVGAVLFPKFTNEAK